ncbi:HelD family protein [Nonomuraea gerenzanensis]|uniref:ATP-dependent DNA helicase rep n=1 Tax=Nonomuraea gerenzanensis TaxID=93944 RepID=A0A1M4ECT5_9ACTN|nr:ATP-binding domain-containing protein [Nonomuraea gerenzanensis]UBU18621.1 ATP-binding domain-containing protein [Nonomuraea gerenzanensis]SBO96468.1 ATP-dependent DNA helicase rep [Nonomuraea gerenzanensis]
MTNRQDGLAQALDTEQRTVSWLYERLDAARENAQRTLREVYAGGAVAVTRQARVEREVLAAEQARRLAQLNAVERGLCFGRIDDAAGGSTYIGRIGLRDESHESVLIDWRAPAARPFYVATATEPGGLVRRRHLHLKDRLVVGIDDEVFDLEGMSEGDRRTLVGEAALLAALRRGRTGRMGDVVATIQTEQDRVIRASLQGALVVQGGPGTGKTVAALHRAAYLLYTHRDTLERRGVLVVGPNPMFLRYIGQVLPALGETQVVMTTVGELFPGVRATAADAPATAVVKGDSRMAGVVAAALELRRPVPDGELVVELDGLRLRVPRETCVRLRERARAVRLPHNMARKLYVTELLKELARAEARALEESLHLEELVIEGEPELSEPLDLEGDLDELDLELASQRLWGEPAVRRAVDGLWPELTPQSLIGGLLADPEALRRAVPPGLDWRVLVRDAKSGQGARPGREAGSGQGAESEWTVEDVPLLDEAAELLGEDDSARRVAARLAGEEVAEQELFAREVLLTTGVAESGLFERADVLADRHADDGLGLTTADRAAADRTWAYGHVIVDEAQELSPMAWRMIMRRVPAKSLTVVGDVAQTGSAAGARSWAEVLDPFLEGRWREERLLVNYRTPVEIMRVAADVLRAFAPEQEPPESVRQGEAEPRAVRLPVSGLPELVAGELAEIGAEREQGRVAVLTPDARHAEVARLFPAGDLDAPVVVLTVGQAKGLEFDAVVVVDPAGIIGQSPMGGQDLYVAMTRATRRLTVAYEGDLPAVLSRLAEKSTM